MPRNYTTPTGITLQHVHSIGSGQFGVANIVRNNRTGHTYCLKEVSVKVTDDRAKHEALTEVKMMKDTCEHPNVITFYESWFERNRLCILMEYAPNGSLDNLISSYARDNKRFPTKKVTHFIEELAGALQYCHDDVGIMHRDIKPANVLIDQIGTLKLADFGMSKVLGPTKLASTFCGSPLYMAPEQLTAGEQYSFSADVWSFGCVAYEIMALRPPWIDSNGEPRTTAALMRRILDASPDYEVLLEYGYPRRLIDTARWMLQRHVHKRATALNIVELLEMRDPPDMAATVRPGQPRPSLTLSEVEKGTSQFASDLGTSTEQEEKKNIDDVHEEEEKKEEEVRPAVVKASPRLSPKLSTTLPLTEVVAEEEVHRRRMAPPTPPSPKARQRAIVEDAKAMIQAADVIRNGYMRLSQQRRIFQNVRRPPPQASPPPRITQPLRPVDRVTAVAGPRNRPSTMAATPVGCAPSSKAPHHHLPPPPPPAIPPPPPKRTTNASPTTPTPDASVALLQKAFRNSLNRRRRPMPAGTSPPKPNLTGHAPHRTAPRRPSSVAAAPMVSHRLQELATPRTPLPALAQPARRRTTTNLAKPCPPSSHTPRPAWV